MNPKMFSHYQILSKIGQGGMGTVYKVYDTTLQRTVALKVIDNIEDNIHLRRFVREVQAMAKLNHPNIIRIYEYGEHPIPFFTMELVEGMNLAKYIKNSPSNWRKIAEIMEKLSEALYQVHKINVLHRDIKPSNIMLTNEMIPKLMDFGLAKDKNAEEEITQVSQTGQIYGSVAYMSPEQARGSSDTRSDIYSVGATLYELLTKQRVFPFSSPYETIYNIFEKEPTSPKEINRDIPLELQQICLKCLEKMPENRYQTAHDLMRDLRNFRKNRRVAVKRQMKKQVLNFFQKYTIGLLLIFFVITTFSLGFLYQQQEKTLQKISKEKKELAKTNLTLTTVSSDFKTLSLQLESSKNIVAKQKEIIEQKKEEIDYLKKGFSHVVERASFYLRIGEEHDRLTRMLERVQNYPIAQIHKSLGYINFINGFRSMHDDPQQGKIYFTRANEHYDFIITQNLMDKESLYFQSLVYANRAKSHAFLNNASTCLKYMNKAIDLMPISSNYVDRAIFYFLFLEKNVQRAIQDLEKAVVVSDQGPHKLTKTEIFAIQSRVDSLKRNPNITVNELKLWFTALVR
ncbi:serine/threonine-protein kinase [Candidatus Uabimicrobium sp. HlEnr_7]|uniref:serine/threonine-protein kinase n=1 Tax=Candidatus Uabimicrobium helgolandensis TaxID=3095367 RepID=UPI0035577F90